MSLPDPDFSYVFFNFVGAQLIHNVVLVSRIQQSELVTRIHVSTPFFFEDSPPRQLIRVLSRVPCATQQLLIRQLSYIQRCSIYTPLPICQLIPDNRKLVFCICGSTSVLQISSYVPFVFRFHIETMPCDICPSVSDLLHWDNLQVCPCCCEWRYLIPLYG